VNPKVIILVDPDKANLVDDTLRAGADEVVSLGSLTAEIVQRVAKLRLDQTIDLATASVLAGLSVAARDYLCRAGSNIAKAVRRLPKAAAEPLSAPDVVKSGNPRLEDLHGYGPAADWGLQLARDLQDFRSGSIKWEDVDRGMLLSGPPGCGKTTFASALAKTCELHLELASYARWFSQGTGGQGDLLKAMKKSFDAAIRNTPSIMFIDEVDSFGDRDAQPDWHAEWSRQVVNALLECLDGAGDREGVVVTGACNNPVIVDPAIKRSGRLDRHIEIPLPDVVARGAILHWHLQTNIDVAEAARRTDGMSGADLERIARDARRVARRERRQVRPDDVLRALPERRAYSPEQLRTIAVHEAGHAVVGLVLGVEKLKHIEIDTTYAPNTKSQSAGGAEWSLAWSGRRDRAYYANLIAMTLGGMASETVIYGGHSDGGSNDLAQASVWAAAIASTYGMNGRLVAVGEVDSDKLRACLRHDPDLSDTVDTILQEQLQRAIEVIGQYRDVVEALTDLLLREHRIMSPRIQEMVHQKQNQRHSQLALAI
jgi:ATP-dependent Zn protease